MNGPRVAVIGIPGKWSTEVLADALESRTDFRLVLDMAHIWADVTAGQVFAGNTNLCELDGIIVKKVSANYSPHCLDRVELLRIAQHAGVRIFSPPDTILRMIDRLACTLTLSNGGIAMPETVVTESVQIACDALTRFGSAVFKPLFSTKARGMQVIDATDVTMRERIATFSARNPMMYIQRKLDLAGEDYGLVFLGGEYLGAYARVGSNEAWNTSIQSGGRYRAYSPAASTVEMAAQAQRLFAMDFTTVDIANGPDGPIVFEVSAFGGFKGAKEGIGIDAAALYADYALADLS